MTVVVAGLVLRGVRMFVQQRGPGPREGLWEFPGGKRQVGETLAQALQREWSEELDIDVCVGDYVTDITLTFPDLPDVLLVLFQIAAVDAERSIRQGGMSLARGLAPTDFTAFEHQVRHVAGQQAVKFLTLRELFALPNVPSFRAFGPALVHLLAERAPKFSCPGCGEWHPDREAIPWCDGCRPIAADLLARSRR